MLPTSSEYILPLPIQETQSHSQRRAHPGLCGVHPPHRQQLPPTWSSSGSLPGAGPARALPGAPPPCASLAADLLPCDAARESAPAPTRPRAQGLRPARSLGAVPGRLWAAALEHRAGSPPALEIGRVVASTPPVEVEMGDTATVESLPGQNLFTSSTFHLSQPGGPLSFLTL